MTSTATTSQTTTMMHGELLCYEFREQRYLAATDMSICRIQVDLLNEMILNCSGSSGGLECAADVTNGQDRVLLGGSGSNGGGCMQTRSQLNQVITGFRGQEALDLVCSIGGFLKMSNGCSAANELNGAINCSQSSFHDCFAHAGLC